MGNIKWSPYILGALTGLLLILSVVVAKQYFGASTTFPRMASVVEATVGVDTSLQEYFTTKKGKYGPTSLPNWQLLFHIGILFGAFFAAKFSGTFKIVKVPKIWEESKGASFTKRAIWAFIGGVIAIIGARLAGGCPSGHGISGVAQLSASSILAFVFFFVGGLISARLILGGKK